MSYGRIINDGAAVEPAPNFFPPNIHTPTEAEYNAHGYYLVAETKPEPPEGQMVTAVRYELYAAMNMIVPHYTYQPIPAPVTTYSVARLIYWITEHELYDAVKNALGEPLMLQAVAVGEFTADNEDFTELKPHMEAAFGAETVAAALAYAAGADAREGE